MVSFICQRLQTTKTLPKFDMLPQQSDKAKETRPQASLLLYINGLIWILLTLRHNHPEHPTFYLFGHKPPSFARVPCGAKRTAHKASAERTEDMAKDFAKAFYDSALWGRIREGILMRDRYTCVYCGRPAQEVHHKIHLSETNINDSNITINADNLISLCRDCHCREHDADRGDANRKKGERTSRRETREGFRFDSNGQLVRC